MGTNLSSLLLLLFLLLGLSLGLDSSTTTKHGEDGLIGQLLRLLLLLSGLLRLLLVRGDGLLVVGHREVGGSLWSNA